MPLLPSRRIPLTRLCISALFCIAARDFQAQPTDNLDSLENLQIIPLLAELHHVQGIEVDEGKLWVTSVDRSTRKGYLHLFELPSGRLLRSTEVQQGDRYHPGGISGDGDTIWIPVATYRPAEPSTIEQRAKSSLELLASFPAEDHIGCLAVDADRVIGGNWDSRRFYIWDKTGKLLATRDNPSPVRYQDMKISEGRLVASGRLDRLRGAVDWLDLESLRIERRILGGQTDRPVCFMNEGMALAGGRLYLLPEDGPSRLFMFELK